jgi:hypothetical protein
MGMGRSILFVSTDEGHRQEYGAGLRAAGWLPLFVPSIERARASLTQFGVAAIVVDADAPHDLAEFGAIAVPLIALGSDAIATDARPLFARVVSQPSNPRRLATIIADVVAGEVGSVEPKSSAEDIAIVYAPKLR